MEVRNCKECGKLFNYLGGQRLCMSCKNKLEEKFDKVKRYIYENKEATLAQISEENEVSVPQLRQWIREERLSFTADSVIGLECEKCGAIIKTGRFCDKCKKEVANNLESAYKHEPKPKPEAKKDAHERAKMRFLDN
ncbi:MAG: flagellar protein [Lachnospiraceae bacterium]|nr:flagellar protein [Lachnospiraceae bacterium]